MSETKKSRKIPNNVINYTLQGIDEKLKLENVKGNSQEANINNIPGIPMEIPMENDVITNETKDGRAVVKDKNGKIIGYLDPDGTLNRKLAEIDKKKAREEGIEH